MDITPALGRLGNHKNATLITLRKDGRAQSSDISYAVDGDTIKISVTHDRAKTRNMQRDNRVVFHFSDPDDYRAAMVDQGRCVVTLTPNSVTGQLN